MKVEDGNDGWDANGQPERERPPGEGGKESVRGRFDKSEATAAEGSVRERYTVSRLESWRLSPKLIYETSRGIFIFKVLKWDLCRRWEGLVTEHHSVCLHAH